MLIKVIALYYVLFGVFHLFFWKLLEWKEQLMNLTPTNRAVVQTLNLCLTFMFFLVAYCFYFYASEIRSTGIGHALIVGMGLFWVVRAILQLLLFDTRQTIHKGLFIVFVIGIVLHVSLYVDY